MTEGLLIEVSERMERFDTHVDIVDGALQQTPEVFRAVRM